MLAGYQSKASEEHVASLQSHLRDVREDAARQAAARDVLQAELRAATDGQRRSEDARHHAEQRAATECSTLHTQVTNSWPYVSNHLHFQGLVIVYSHCSCKYHCQYLPKVSRSSIM